MLAGVAPELAPQADRMRALGEGRWELKVVIDAACQRGIKQLRALLSHVDPHLTLGQLVERLVQDGLERYDPGRPPRGTEVGRREASAGRAPEPKAQQGPAGGATLPAKPGTQEQPRVPPTPGGTSAGGSPPRRQRCPQRNAPAGLATPAPRRWQRCPRRRQDARRAVAAPAVSAKPAAATGTATSAANCVADRGSHAPVPTPPADQTFRPRGQRRIAVATLLRQRSGQGWRCGQGRRCGSRFLLELDHIVPFALGGSAEPGNLRHCSAHHRFRHREYGSPPDGAT